MSITNDDLQSVAGKIFMECLKLMKTKGHDYAPEGDSLKRFRELAGEVGLTSNEVIYVFLSKHLNSIKSYALSGQLESESLLSRIEDCINYLILLYADSIEADADTQDLCRGGRVVDSTVLI